VALTFEKLIDLLKSLSPLDTAIGIGTPLTTICLWLLRKLKIARSGQEALLTRLELAHQSERELRAGLAAAQENRYSDPEASRLCPRTSKQGERGWKR
jgi:hypothetical protein